MPIPKEPTVTDPNALAAIVRGLGGNPIPGRTFTFDLPVEKVREAVPRLNDLGIGVRKVAERQEENPTKLGCTWGVATLELFKRGE